MWQQGWVGLCLLLASAASPKSAAVKLEWKFKDGDKFYLEEKTVAKQTMKLMGSTFNQELSHTRVTRFTVLRKTESGLVLEEKIEKVRIDRATGTSQTGAKVLRDLEGATFKVTLDKHMRVTRFEGYEGLIKKFKKNEAVAKMIRVLIPEEVFAKPVENLFAFLPERPVDRGTTWKGQEVRPLGPLGQLQLKETVTFQGAARGQDKDILQIDVAVNDSIYQLPSKTEIMEFRIVKGELNVDKKKTSRTIYFNRAVGRMVRSVALTQLNGNFTVSAMGTMLVMEIEQNESIAARMLDKNPLP